MLAEKFILLLETLRQFEDRYADGAPKVTHTPRYVPFKLPMTPTGVVPFARR